jgi:cytochrome c biogenesis protein CcmG/thiol:disulfide interchange protein DsbE
MTGRKIMRPGLMRPGLMRPVAALPVAVILLLAGCTSGGSPSASAPSASAPSASTGQPPPAAKSFTLKKLDQPGGQISLAAYAGKPVIINFFASWCTPCKKETPLLAKFYKSSHGKVVIIGVDANDEAGPAKKFVQAADVTYPVAVDPFPAKTTTSYGVFALPQTFFLNSRHHIVKKIIGGVTLTQLTKGVALIDNRNTSLAAGAQGQG